MRRSTQGDEDVQEEDTTTGEKRIRCCLHAQENTSHDKSLEDKGAASRMNLTTPRIREARRNLPHIENCKRFVTPHDLDPA